MRVNNDHTFAVLTYKESPYIYECIRSLLNQSVTSKIILYTSTPNNHIKECARKFEIELKINKIRQNIGNDWNFALQDCSTNYLTLVHQDDIYTKNYLEKVLNNVTNDFLIIFSFYNIILHSQKKSTKLLIKKILLFPFYLKNEISITIIKKFILLFDNPIPCPGVTYNLKKVKNVKFSTKYKNHLDWLYWISLSELNGSFIFLKEKLFSHRVYNSSTSMINRNEKITNVEDYMILQKLWPKPFAYLIYKLKIMVYSLLISK